MQQNIRINDPTAPGPTIRFQMEKMCRHWRGEVHGGGPDPLYILEVGGRDGRKADKIPLEHDGFFWWIDMPRAELGAPGMHVRICAITQFDGREGRGLSKEYFVSKNGRAGMSWSYIATWDLV
ncbi:MAG: hypothetical protein INR71_12140 [Terriglobus roseus]|nr:hypothetical protein [Terriglobus roseus]